MNTLSHLKFHYFYKITNTENNCFYYGIHSTNNLNDGYMGSGSKIRALYRIHGRNKFIKEIIRFFDSRQEASQYEKQIVNEKLLQDPKCLNMVLGGDMEDQVYGATKGLVTVRDKDGNSFDVKIDDPRYIEGILCPVCKGFATVRDKDGKCFKINIQDPKYIKGDYVPVSKGNRGFKNKITIYKDSEYLVIDKYQLDQYINEGWIIRSKCKGRISPTKGMVHLFKDGKNIMVNRNLIDSYIKNGWINKRNISPLHNTICISKDGKNMYVDEKDIDLYIKDGWKKGGTSRNKGKITCTLDGGKTYIQLDKDDELILNGIAKTAFQLREPSCKGLKYIHKNKIVKRIKPDLLQQYIDDGWVLGKN